MRIDYFRSLSIPVDPVGTVRSIQIYYDLLQSTTIFELVPSSPQSRALDFDPRIPHFAIVSNPGRSDGPHARFFIGHEPSETAASTTPHDTQIHSDGALSFAEYYRPAGVLIRRVLLLR